MKKLTKVQVKKEVNKINATIKTIRKNKYPIMKSFLKRYDNRIILKLKQEKKNIIKTRKKPSLFKKTSWD